MTNLNSQLQEVAPMVSSVFFLTDFSDSAKKAFIHALVIALYRKAELTILHVGDKNLSGNEWNKFPPVRDTLEVWGLLEEGSDQKDVFDRLGVKVQKIELIHTNVTEAAFGYLGRNPADLLVLATESRKGLSRLVKPSIAEKLSRKVKAKTLFVPEMSPGFVTKGTGDITLNKILVPIDAEPDPRAAIGYASRAASVFDDEKTEIILLNIGETESWPVVNLPESDSFTWKKVFRTGNPVEQINKVARDEEVNLIIMPTAGRDGLLDVLRGSVTEKVLHQAPCPLLAVPSD